MYKIPAKTLFVGQKLVFVPECQSTNSLMLELASKSSLPEGAVLITSNQFAGRGQRGNSWQVAAGLNLTFSLLLKPSFLSARNQFTLTTIASLAVSDYLQAKQVADVKIKWPNDILVGRKKICGMLIENSIQGDLITQSVVGIGLNINQVDFPIASATSLGKIKGQNFDLNDEWGLLLEKLEGRYLQLRSGKKMELKAEYLNQLIGMNHEQKFRLTDTEVTGVVKNVTEAGELIILVDGIERSFSLKEISFVL